jgi:hypothetical protein
MMLRRPVFLSFVCACGAALALAATVRAAAVTEFTDGVLPLDGQKALEDAYNREQAALIKDLRDGRLEATKEHDAAIDVYARYYTYRLTWPDIQSRPGGINGVISDLDGDLFKAMKNRASTPSTQPFLQKLAAALVLHAKEVLKNRESVARFNAVRIMWEVAHTGFGGPETARALVEVINNPAHDPATRYWAFKAVQEVLAPDGKMPPKSLQEAADGKAPAKAPKDQLQTQVVEALLKFLDEKLPLAPGATPDEVDGVRVLRREAIHALALTRAPAVTDDKGKVAGRTAQVLLRVVRKEGFVPEPRWDEQVEAAIGIGWMQGKLYPDFQPDYALYNAAYAVVELAQQYTNEEGSKVDKGWRYHAARLAEAFDNLQKDAAANSKDKALLTYLNDVGRRAGAQLRLMETKGTADPAGLNDWLQNNPPKNDTLYKGVDDSKVAPGQATEK